MFLVMRYFFPLDPCFTRTKGATNKHYQNSPLNVALDLHRMIFCSLVSHIMTFRSLSPNFCTSGNFEAPRLIKGAASLLVGVQIVLRDVDGIFPAKAVHRVKLAVIECTR